MQDVAAHHAFHAATIGRCSARDASPLPASKLFPPRVELLLDFLIGNGAAGVRIFQAPLHHSSERQFAENLVVAAVLGWRAMISFMVSFADAICSPRTWATVILPGLRDFASVR